MSDTDTLTAWLERAAHKWADRTAAQEPDGRSITYRQLDILSSRVQAQLQRIGVAPGDRVGIFLPKSIDALAAIIGVLKAGAAYVPVDSSAPAARAAYILNDCVVRAVFLDQSRETALCNELDELGFAPELIVVPDAGSGGALEWALNRLPPAPGAATSAVVKADDLAYILYTSGSTGKPKGVMLSHRNAVSFVDWCTSILRPTPSDRFSSHAPLHFDLSILDLYVPLVSGACVLLISAELGKEPVGLARLIADQAITVWYSTPSVLSLMTQFGKMDRQDYRSLRFVLFAGEVFPVKHLRALQQFWPHPRYLNLYGPTETNVCTAYELREPVPADRMEPYPIGTSCSHVRTRVVDDTGSTVAGGQEGELVVTGAGVMQGYWNLPEQTARAFLTDSDGTRWYRTGDIVLEAPDGNYTFLGRRDRMVKRRGYRIELGEIETALYRQKDVKEAAVVSLRGRDGGVLIKAFLTCREGVQPTLIELKRFCADTLPLYMIPDQFEIQDAIPKTSTDKIDYQRLMRPPNGLCADG